MPARRRLRLVRVAVAVTVLMLSAVIGTGPAAAEGSVVDLEQVLIDKLNAERIAEGLEPVTPYWDLTDDARAHSQYLLESGKFHHNPDLTSVTTGWYALGENIAIHHDIFKMHEAWMASPGHRANILGDYNYVGVGVAVDEAGSIWGTQVLMRGPEGLVATEPDPAAPSVADGDSGFEGKDPVAHLCPAGADCATVGVVDEGARFKLGAAATSGDDRGGFYFGNPGDIPLMGDWDCDGERTPGQYRSSDGYVYLRNSNTAGAGEIRFFFGNPGDLPLVGDFDGDGCDTVSIHRPGTGQVFIINSLGENDGGLGGAEFSYFFGDPGDKAFAGDFDGDGIDTVGLHRESTGLVYFINEHRSGPAAVKFIFGDPGDKLLAGDWNGDGTDTPALYRPSDGKLYLKLSNAAGVADEVVPVGGSVAGVVRASR